MPTERDPESSQEALDGWMCLPHDIPAQHTRAACQGEWRPSHSPPGFHQHHDPGTPGSLLETLRTTGTLLVTCIYRDIKEVHVAEVTLPR